MDFDWTTFILEIINFLILVWILKRFLYQPVLDVIARRQTGIEKTLADARQIETEANALKHQNEQYLKDWETQKEKAQAELSTELAAIRERKMAELDLKINEEAARRRVLDERSRQEFECLCEEKGIAQGAEFSSKLLSRLASPELEARLFNVLLDDLRQLSQTDQHAVVEASIKSGLHIKVQSVYPLAHQQRETLQQVLNEITGRTLPVDFLTNPELIAGLQIDIGPWILHANVRDELKFFTGVIRHAG